MPQKKVIVTRPEHDIVTSYLACWAEEVILLAHKMGINIKDLGCEKVNREEFEKFILKQNPFLVLINGHGDCDSIEGHKGEVILKKGENEEILKGKIVYALACHSANELGPAAIKSGAKAYIGYEFPFGFLTDKNKQCVPEEDNMANIFKEASNQVSISLVKGKKVKKAYENSQNKFRELIKQFSASDALSEAKEIRFWLFWDMYGQRCLGDSEAVF